MPLTPQERSARATKREAAKRTRAATRKANPAGYLRYIAAVVDRKTGLIRWSTVRGGEGAAVTALIRFLVQDGAVRPRGSPAATGKPALSAADVSGALRWERINSRWIASLPINDDKEVAQIVRALDDPI
jgi:hypothetical protein